MRPSSASASPGAYQSEVSMLKPDDHIETDLPVAEAKMLNHLKESRQELMFSVHDFGSSLNGRPFRPIENKYG